MSHLTAVMRRPGHTPQTERATPEQVVNSAGGYVFQLDEWARLERFLILGTERGTYYTTEQKLTKENAEHLLKMLLAHGPEVVKLIVGISTTGRAPKQDYGIFALAACAGLGDTATRQAAFAALPQVCRTGSTLLRFASYVGQFRGWGMGLRKAVARWFNERPVDAAAYQLLKYQERYGWSMMKLLRKAHPNPTVVNDTGDNRIVAAPEGARHKFTSPRDALYGWSVGKGERFGDELLPPILRSYKAAHAAASKPMSLRLPGDEGIDWEALTLLSHEMVPTEWKKHCRVWETLLPKMPLGARLRNLATLTRLGVASPGMEWTQELCRSLTDPEALKRSRIHPAAILVALATYRTGKSLRGDSTWIPTPEIVRALDVAFYASFGNVVPAGKRTYIGLDVSASMDVAISSVPGLSAREATTALAMIQVATEPHVEVWGFTSGGVNAGFQNGYGSRRTALTKVPLARGQQLPDVMEFTRRLPMGGTDCALPMLDAMQRKVEIDTFVVYTDNETWAGGIQPFEALKQYRAAMGIPAKLVVVATTSTEFTIADPSDAGMLDVIGFDAAAPALIADFSRGGAAGSNGGDEPEE